eukprot:3259942-Pleurochrysis_carterae.AAC.1
MTQWTTHSTRLSTPSTPPVVEHYPLLRTSVTRLPERRAPCRPAAIHRAPPLHCPTRCLRAAMSRARRTPHRSGLTRTTAPSLLQ